jgi:hypothetical protein
MPFSPSSSIVKEQQAIKKELKAIFAEAMQMHKSLPGQDQGRSKALDKLVDKLNMLNVRATNSRSDATANRKQKRIDLTLQTINDINLARQRLLHYKALCDVLSNPEKYINAEKGEYALPNTRAAQAIQTTAPPDLFTDKAFAKRSNEFVKNAKSFNDDRLLEWHRSIDKRISRQQSARKTLGNDLVKLEKMVKQYQELQKPSRFQRLFQSHYAVKRQLKATEISTLYNHVLNRHKALNKDYKAIRKDVKRFDKSLQKLNIVKAENKKQRRFLSRDLAKSSQATKESKDFLDRFNAISTAVAQDKQLPLDLRAADIRMVYHARDQLGIYQPIPLYENDHGQYQALPANVAQIQPVYQAAEQYQSLPAQPQPVYQQQPAEDIAAKAARAPLPEPIARDAAPQPVYQQTPPSAEQIAQQARPNLPPPPQFNRLAPIARTEAQYAQANQEALQAAQREQERRMQNRQPLPDMGPAQQSPPSTEPQQQQPVSPHATEYARDTAALAARRQQPGEQVAPHAQHQEGATRHRRPPPSPPQDPYAHTRALNQRAQQQQQQREAMQQEYAGEAIRSGEVPAQPAYRGEVLSAADANRLNMQTTAAPQAAPLGVRPPFVRPNKPLPPLPPMGQSENQPAIIAARPAPTDYQPFDTRMRNLPEQMFPKVPTDLPPPAEYAGLVRRANADPGKERAFPKPQTLAEQEKKASIQKPSNTKKSLLSKMAKLRQEREEAKGPQNDSESAEASPKNPKPGSS